MNKVAGNKSHKISGVSYLSEVSEHLKVWNVLRYPLQGESQIAAPCTTNLEEKKQLTWQAFWILEETSHLGVCYFDPLAKSP